MIAVGFDFDHTLGIDNKLERTAFVQIAAAYAQADGYMPDDAKSANAIEAALAKFRGGRLCVEAALDEAFSVVFGHHHAQAVEDFRDLAIAMVPRYVEALPGVREMLVCLDENSMRRAVLTNGWSPLQETKAAAVGEFSAVLVSERIGHRKPFPEAFFHLMDALQTDASDIWFVGDDPVSDIGGALSVGMTAVWFNWEERPYPAELPPPSHTIAHMDELAALLLCHERSTL